MHSLASVVLLLLLFNVARSHCPPGHIPPLPCFPCPPGTYVNSTTRTTCAPCPAGTHRRTPAAEHPDQCLPCPAGAYSTPRSASCTPCAPGYDSRTAAPQCSRCPPGSRLRLFSNRFGSAGCQPCAAGTFSNATSNRFCEECFDGTYTRNSGRRVCKKCPPGTFALSRPPALRSMDLMFVGSTIGCESCPRGTYNGGRGASFCKICPVGTVSSRGNATCTPCPPGTYSKRILSGRCRPCPDGTTSLGKKPAACKKVGGGCPWNTFLGKGGDCEACLPGERLDVATKRCVACGPGAVSKGGAETTCKMCAVGMEPLPDGSKFARSECRCRRGTVNDGSGRCVKCPAGTFWYPLQNTYGYKLPDLLDYPGPSAPPNTPVFPYCKQCPRGFYQDREGMDHCFKCPMAHFSMHRGSKKCLQCPGGAVNPEEYGERVTTTCISTETNCVAGFERKFFPGVPGSYERSYLCVPSKCSMPGTFLDRLSRQCISCRPGLRFDSVHQRCVKCNGGVKAIGAGGTETKCRECPPHAESRSGFEEDVSECLCKIGYGLVDGTCTLCPPGTESRRTADRIRRCVLCKSGTFSDVYGGQCQRCAENQVTEGPGARKCLKCPGKCRLDISVMRVPLNRCMPSNAYCDNLQWIARMKRQNADFIC